MRGSRLQKILKISAVMVIVATVGLLGYYRYDQDARAYLNYQYCQNFISLREVAHQLEVFQPLLAENVYLEETFDQKILPQIKNDLISRLKPLHENRVTRDDHFVQVLEQDELDLKAAKNISGLLKNLETRSQRCERTSFVRGVFPPKIFVSQYPQQHSLKDELPKWQQTLVELKPLAIEVKQQIESDFHTLCQGWKNLAQAKQISRYFQMQCDRPQAKKKCSAEQNEKLKQYAGDLEEQFQTNYAKFRKKWTKISLAGEEMQKKCL